MVDRVDRSDLGYQAIYQKLQELARSKSIATYTDIAYLGGIEVRDPNFGELLNEINREEHGQEHPLLSALVTHGKGSMPGEGFFESAKRLRVFEGTGTKERREFWLAEKRRVYDYWSKVEVPVAKKEARGILKVTMPVKGRRWIYATIGVWQASNNRINIALPGKRFFCASKQPAGDHSHQLFGILKELLKENGRWKKGSS